MFAIQLWLFIAIYLIVLGLSITLAIFFWDYKTKAEKEAELAENLKSAKPKNYFPGHTAFSKDQVKSFKK